VPLQKCGLDSPMPVLRRVEYFVAGRRAWSLSRRDCRGAQAGAAARSPRAIN
jgi:hypothetical protein